MAYSICKGGDCPMKETCLRFLATPNEDRVFWEHPPYIDDGYSVVKCDGYDEIRLIKSEVPALITGLKEMFNID